MPDWVNSGCSEYSKRMPPELRIKTIEIALGARGKSQSSSKAIETEGQAILKAVGEKDFVVALDVLGKTMSTTKLASNLAKWQMDGHDISLLIGGPDGLSDECLKRANASWSLSKLTFPHFLVRVLLAELIYRAWSILNKHPYHK